MDEYLEICKKVKEALEQKTIKNQQLAKLEAGSRQVKELYGHVENTEHFKELSNKMNQKLKILEKQLADKRNAAIATKKNRKKTLNVIQEHYEKKITGAPEEYKKKNLKTRMQNLLDEELTLDETLANLQGEVERIQKTFPYKAKQLEVKKVKLISKATSEEKIELSHKCNLTSMEIRYIERDLKKELKATKN